MPLHAVLRSDDACLWARRVRDKDPFPYMLEDNPTAFEQLPLLRQQPPQRLRIGLVFLLEDASGQGFRSVVVDHPHRPLDDNRPGVEFFVHEVDGAA